MGKEYHKITESIERGKKMASEKKQNEKDAMGIINRHIETGSFEKVYLLYGEEKYLILQYRDKLLKAITDTDDTMNFSRFVGDKPDTREIIEFCETMPFLADRRVVLVEESGLFKTSCEEFANDIATLPDTAILVFVETAVDARNKLYKTVDKYGEALNFKTPDERTLSIWVKSQFKAEQKKVEDTAIYKLIESAGTDMSRIKNEIEKLVCYTMDIEVITAQDVEELCIENIESKIFAMVDAIAEKRQDRALHLYHELLENREEPMRILALIARQYDILLKTKLCSAEKKNDAQIASTIGVPSWAVKKYNSQCQRYSIEELKGVLEACQEIDYKVKTGQTTDIIAVELLIVDLSR